MRGVEGGSAGVLALAAGDARAFDEAWREHRPRIFSFTLRMTGSRAVAEDLTQETFLRLARHAPTLPPDTVLAAWLFTVARNLCVSWRRWRVLDRLAGPRWAESAETVEATTPHDEAVGHEARARLERALGALPPKHREVLLLVAVEQLEPADAARALSISPENLRQRLARARAALASSLEEGALR
jgi:RNA polymerase sigma factor (sigma-70 family)